MARAAKSEKKAETRVSEDSLETNAKAVIDIVSAAIDSDYSQLRTLCSHLIRQYSAAGLEGQAGELRRLLRKRSAPLRTSGHMRELPVDARSRLPLVDENPWPSTPILLEAKTEAIVNRFIEDANNAERLAKAGIESSLRLILCGPPGTGKTLLASHIAARLNKPFHVGRLDSTISSLLGETAKNIRGIFDYVSEHSRFVFLDEIDAIAKMRDDQKEVGELKRVVNTLIQGLDDLDDQTVVIAATNHPRLLDPAIWRRFPYRIELGQPESDLRTELWRHYLAEHDTHGVGEQLAKLSDGLSPADIKELAHGARRAAVIGNRDMCMDDLTRSVLRSTSGSLAVPTGLPLSADERRKLVDELLPYEMTRSQMASLVGVSRQRVDEYVRALDVKSTVQEE